MLTRPKEHEYVSHVAYTRALEAYCDALEATEILGYVAVDYEIDGHKAFQKETPEVGQWNAVYTSPPWKDKV